MTLGERLRERRLELGWSQEGLASAVGMPSTRLCDLECGRTPLPRFVTIAKLAPALEISLDELANYV